MVDRRRSWPADTKLATTARKAGTGTYIPPLCHRLSRRPHLNSCTMKLLRRRVRRSFLFAAVGFLVIGLLDLTRQDYAAYGISPVHHFGFIAFCLLQGGIYAAAWFTTKMPSPYRNNWAVAGSLFTLAWAGFDLWLHHTDIMAARGGIAGLILAIAGLYVFGQGGSSVRSESATESPAAAAAESRPAARPAPITGDRTSASRPPVDATTASRTAALAVLATAPVPRTGVPAISATIPRSDTLNPTSGIAAGTLVTAPAAGIRTVVPSASSADLAAAANSPEAPAEPRWDPLSFIRNPSGA
jgi:hypothetical protein